jgi:hypothetical protein
MKDVADTYFAEDAEHEEMMNKFSAQLEEYESGTTFPKYTPPSPNASGPNQYY